MADPQWVESEGTPASAIGVRREKVALFQWVQIPPGEMSPAESNRSSHGGNEVAEAFDVEGHIR